MAARPSRTRGCSLPRPRRPAGAAPPSSPGPRRPRSWPAGPCGAWHPAPSAPRPSPLLTFLPFPFSVQNLGPEGETNPERAEPWRPYVPPMETRTHPEGDVAALAHTAKGTAKAGAAAILRLLTGSAAPLAGEGEGAAQGGAAEAAHAATAPSSASPPPTPAGLVKVRREAAAAQRGAEAAASAAAAAADEVAALEAAAVRVAGAGAGVAAATASAAPGKKGAPSAAPPSSGGFMSRWLAAGAAKPPAPAPSSGSRGGSPRRCKAPPALPSPAAGALLAANQAAAAARGAAASASAAAAVAAAAAASALASLSAAEGAAEAAACKGGSRSGGGGGGGGGGTGGPAGSITKAAVAALGPPPQSSPFSVGGGGSGCLADPAAVPHPGRPSSFLATAALTRPGGVIKCFPGASSNRVYSIAFHPTPHKLVAMAGGRFGQLTLWVPGDDAVGGGGGGGGGAAGAAAPAPAHGKRARSSGDGGEGGEGESEGEGEGGGGGGGGAMTELAVFDLHSEVIAAIAVPSAAPHNIFTASLDTTIRCLDAVTGVSYDIHEDPGKPAALCFECGGGGGWGGGHTFWVGNREGELYHLDTRLRSRGAGRGPGGTSGVLQAHTEGKKISTVCLQGGGAGGALLTASGDGTAKLWDARKLPRHSSGAGGKKPEPLATLQHGSTVCSAYFSPWGGHIASASNDDLVRVWDTAAVLRGELAPRHAIKHDMHTGA